MAPKRVLGLKEQLIFNDLKLMHQIKHGRSPVNFDKFFTISKKKNRQRKNQTKHLQALTQAFTRRIHMYWNYLPVKTRNLPPALFKERVIEIFMDKKYGRHRQNLLNFGLDPNGGEGLVRKKRKKFKRRTQAQDPSKSSDSEEEEEEDKKKAAENWSEKSQKEPC